MFEHSIQQLAEEKLYILFVLNESPVKLSKNTITHIFMEHQLLNFFSLQQYLYELAEDGFVFASKDSFPQTFAITDRGKQILEYFSSSLPYSKRESIKQYMIEKNEQLHHEKEIQSHYRKVKEHTYLVELSLLNEDEPFFSMNLFVPSSSMARTICENWQNENSNLYMEIVNLLTVNHPAKK